MIELEPISYKPEELLAIAKWRNEVLHTLRSSEPTPISIEHQKKWVDSLKETDKYHFVFLKDYSTFSNSSHILIGYCGLDKVNHTNKTAEMSLLIDPYTHGQGHGKRTVQLLLKKAFDSFHLNCVYIETYLTTNAWIFWEKQGFVKEGHLRDRKWWDGRFFGSVIASITKEEWEQLNDS